MKRVEDVLEITSLKQNIKENEQNKDIKLNYKIKIDKHDVKFPHPVIPNY